MQSRICYNVDVFSCKVREWNTLQTSVLNVNMFKVTRCVPPVFLVWYLLFFDVTTCQMLMFDPGWGQQSIFTLLKHPSYLVHCISQLIYHFGIFVLSCMEDNYSTYVTNWHFGVFEEDGLSYNSCKVVTNTDDLVCTFTIRRNWDLYFSAILCSVWWEFLTDILGLIGCPKILVRNYHYMLCNILEDSISYLLHGGCLKSHKKTDLQKSLHVQFVAQYLLIVATCCSHRLWSSGSLTFKNRASYI
jgi:hypothetical protein